MNLPPLANLLALRARDPDVLRSLETALRQSGLYEKVGRPASSWLIGVTPLPGAKSELEASTRTFFAEGAHLFPDTKRIRDVVATAAGEPRALVRFSGDFGFLHFEEDGSLVGTRSCGGRLPVYVWETDAVLAVGTRLTDTIRFVHDEVSLDTFTTALWVGGGPSTFPDGRTFFRGVSAVPRGHVFHFPRTGAMRLHRYWDPRPDDLPRRSREREEEHVRRLRSLLLTHLEDELDPSGGNLLTLSGGVDSSSLAALSAGTLGRPLNTVTFLPPSDPARERARHYVEVLRDRFEFERSWEFPISPAHRLEFLRSAPTVAFPVVHPALALLSELRKEEPLRVMLGGEFADETCGSTFTIPDWARHTTFRDLVAHPRSLPRGPRSIKPWLQARWANMRGSVSFPWKESLPTWINRDVRSEYDEWIRRRTESVREDDRPWRNLALRTELDGVLAMNWEVTSELGIRRSWPFFHREILELAFDCHPGELVGPGIKKLIRAALREDVPAENLFRERFRWPPTERRLPMPPDKAELGGVFSQDEQVPADWTKAFWEWTLVGLLQAVRTVRGTL